ncbi:MAG TPA: DUF1361 domain-containing protein [bacterium]|nr:DUF1361 domain-containing protein [bacterium]
MSTLRLPALRSFAIALGLSSALGLFLLAARIWFTGNRQYGFLAWNLLLAWIPLGFALVAARRLAHSDRLSRWSGWSSLAAWLLFFPNAPYIFTDFIHFRRVVNVPWWFDLGMLLTFAATGLLLGLASLLVAHRTVAALAGPKAGWVFAGTSTLLCGFGIYLGRFQRWNTWDVLSDPLGIAYDVAHRLVFPLEHPRAWGVTLLFGGLMAALYLAFHALTQLGTSPERHEA